MPGMMDTVLNLGLNDDVVEGLASKAGNRFAWDSYRRLLDMFASVVLGIDHHNFDIHLEAVKVLSPLSLKPCLATGLPLFPFAVCLT
jgi:pyruvate, orthophosphate dikinase